MRLSHPLAVALCATLVVALTGCADNSDDSATNAPSTVKLYGTDGNMQNSFAEEFSDPAVLAGMKGTAPLTQLSAQFTNKLLEIDSSLESFLYAGENYDAVVISALAAELAGTPEPKRVREYIKAVTTGGERCDTVADCLQLARDGQDFAYRGVTLRHGGLTDANEPSSATYATQHFDRDGRIDEGKNEFVRAGDSSTVTTEPSPRPGPRPDGPEWEIEPLRLGGMLPKTGGLSFAYPPLRAGVTLAIEEINDAGGVFGVDVEWVDGDDGTSVEVALETFASHLADDVHILIGPAASSVVEAVLPEAVAAERIIVSPTGTAPHLTELEHNGFFFRTAPSDLLQGAALADVIMRDGLERVAIVARDDRYGDGLTSNIYQSLRRFGVPATDIVRLTYPAVEEESEKIPDLPGLTDRIISARPDGIVIVGYSETAQIIQDLADNGLL